MDRRKRATIFLLILGLSLCFSPPTGAQGEDLLLQLAGIEDHAFPQLVAHLRVVDGDGVPVPALTERDFAIVERGGEARTLDAVTGETTRPLALVLALDLSVSAADWRAIAAGIEALLAACRDHDRVGLVTFADQAETTVKDRAPEEALRAVRDLVPRGDYTDLHSAVLLAAQLASESSLPRSAVLVLTDSWDNRGAQSLSDTLSQLEDVDVPVHVIGLGSRMSQVESEPLISIARATGGLAYRLPDTARLSEQLDAVALMLRHEYRVVYRSTFQADDQPYRAQFAVTTGGVRAEVEGTYTARSREVNVALSGLVEGQRASGLVALALRVEGAALPIQKVEYWLDNQLLGASSEAPFLLTWDSGTVTPGAYTLTARASDVAGNAGAADVRIEVVEPVTIFDLTLPAQVPFGEQVTVEARVQSEAAIESVSLYLDGRDLGNAEAVGTASDRYRLAIDSTAWTAGEHLLTLRARDGLGRSAEETRSLRFAPAPTPVPTATPTPVPAPAPDRTGLRDAIALSTAGASVIAAGVLTVAIARGQRRRQVRVLPVEIRNQGNVRDRYALHADDPDEALTFEWRCDGAPLPRVPLLEGAHASTPPTTEEAGRGPSAPPATGEDGWGPDAAQQRALPLPPGGRPGGGQPSTLQAVQERASLAMRLGGALSSLLNTIASLLPRAAQAPLRRISRQIGRGRSTVGQARMASSRATRLARSGPPPTRGAGRGRLPRPDLGQGRGRPTRLHPTAASSWSQTPYVDPGRAITVELRVDPVRPYREQQRTLRVLSCSAELAGAPLAASEQVLLIPGVSLFRRWAPYALLYLAAAAVSLVVFWLVRAGALGV
jgi:hypothetical protein